MHIITDKKTTIVDGHDYTLTLDEAADALLAGKNVVGEPYPDYGLEEEDIVAAFGEQPAYLRGADYRGKPRATVIEELRQYAGFAFDGPPAQTAGEHILAWVMPRRELLNIKQIERTAGVPQHTLFYAVTGKRALPKRHEQRLAVTLRRLGYQPAEAGADVIL